MADMKKIILILGANGVGKSTTSEILLQKLAKCAFIDADWCRAINPFPFTEATKIAVSDNIYSLFKNYLLCEDIEFVIFPYGFHGERKQIFEQVLSRLRQDDIAFELCPIILKCDREENIKRAVKNGREKERIERGMKNTYGFYDTYTYPQIDTTHMQPEDVAEKILDILKLS
ncbi:MAG: AAA family ATPase [Lachnospiraceae bacterium]|nr:AAA family ATPase [Lachnospiraceae bacterium]